MLDRIAKAALVLAFYLVVQVAALYFVARALTPWT